MRAVAGLAAAAVLLLLAACGGSSQVTVAKVGSKPITKQQLNALLTATRKRYSGPTFPARGSAEYRLVQEQAIDYLVQQSLADQVDAELGIKPEDRVVVTDASWRKVVAGIHVTDAQVRAVFEQNPKRYKLPGSNRTLDRGAAGEIRSELLATERGAAMHRFIAAAEKRWPVTYAPGYRPVSEMALAREIWKAPPKKACDLRPGSYAYPTARAHGCVGGTPIPGIGSPACSLLAVPEGDSGFSSAEMNDGYAEYLMDNGGTCSEDPRLQYVQVAPRPNTTPVEVAYLHASGMATYKHPLIEFTLRYPRRFHVQQVSYGGVESTDGVEVANYPLGPATSGRPLAGGAVDFTFTAEAFGQITSSWPSISSPHKTTLAKLPLRITHAELASGRYRTGVSADGLSLTLSITTGSSPSRRDLDALRAIAASIRFPPLRIGQFTPSRLYVLGRASAYPLGSVTEITAGLPLPYHRKLRSGPFYLEHTADGFWTMTWPSNYLHDYKACGPRFDATRRRFTCPSGAVWDLQGRVLRNPDPAKHPDDPLIRARALVAGGFLLVSLSPPG